MSQSLVNAASERQTFRSPLNGLVVKHQPHSCPLGERPCKKPIEAVVTVAR
jgi:hypothetical protein